MSIKVPSRLRDTDSETDDIIELNTLPRPVRRISKTMATTTTQQQQQSKKQEKRGLKERIFGTKRPSKGSSKFDVVRSVEILNYTNRTDHDTTDGDEQPLRKPSFIPVKTFYKFGHKFDPHSKPTWCDVCEDFIWGLYTQAIRCQHCRYTCHAKCVRYVMLDCPKAPSQEKTREDLTKETLEILSESNGRSMERKNNNLPSFVSSISQLRGMIDEYNSKSSLIMTLHDDCTFDGFIRVHMNLNRPVNVSSDVSNLTLKKAVLRTKSGKSKRPLSQSRRPVTELFPDSTVVKNDEDSGVGSESSTLSAIESAALSTTSSSNTRKGKRARRLSFYMPKGTYKPLHVTSTTTAKEVIEALLSKYNVTDNPKKFALYEQYVRKDSVENETVYRKMQSDEQPLSLCLSWGAKETMRSFALKEDEEGTVQWMNFEVPELDNFLKILQLEEDELMAQIYQKYEDYRHALRSAMETKNVVHVEYKTSDA